MIRGPDERALRYKKVIESILLPKRAGRYSELIFYKELNKIASKTLTNNARPVRNTTDLLFVTKPSFLDQTRGGSHLISTISQRDLSLVPTVLREEEVQDVKIAYAFIQFLLNMCVMIIQPDIPSEETKATSRKILKLAEMYKLQSEDDDTRPIIHRTSTYDQRQLDNILLTATAMVTSRQTTSLRVLPTNAFFGARNFPSLIEQFRGYLLPRAETYRERNDTSPTETTIQNITAIRTLLEAVNRRRICGRGGTFQRSLGSSGPPDALMATASHAAGSILAFYNIRPKSPGVSIAKNMIQWARLRLQRAIGNSIGTTPTSPDAVVRTQFLKQGESLRKATENACKLLGGLTVPVAKDGFVVSTSSDTLGQPVDSTSENRAASVLYSKTQAIHRDLIAEANKAFDTVFTITNEPIPGSFNIPLSDDNKTTTESRIEAKTDTKVTYLVIRPDVITAASPIEKIATSLASLVYSVAKAYDSLVTLIETQNIRKVYGIV